METPVDFKDILELASDIEVETRKPGLRRNVSRQMPAEEQLNSITPDKLAPKIKSESENTPGRKSLTPAFQESSKDIFNTDIVTSGFDKPTGGDTNSTSHFLSKPRPMTSSLGDERPLVNYKCKTLSGSSAVLSGRRRNTHNTLEREYRGLKEGMVKVDNKQEISKDDHQPVAQENASTPFKKYIDSLWDKRGKNNFELLRTTELKMNFLPEQDLSKPNLSYSQW